MPKTEQGKKPHIFVFLGENSFAVEEKVLFWRNEFIKKYGSNGMFASDGADVQDANTFTVRIKAAIRSASLFGGPKLSVIKNIEKLPDNVIETLFSYIPQIDQGHFLVLTIGKNDKRKELFKTLQKYEKNGTLVIEEFKTPRDGQLAQWVQNRFDKKGYAITSEVTAYFLHYMGETGSSSFEAPDILRITNEISKLCSSLSDKKITKDAVNAITSGERAGIIFDLSDAILAGNVKNALTISHTLVSQQKGAIKQSLLGLLGYLTKEMRGLAILRGALDGNNSEKYEKLLGWSPQRLWVAKKKIHPCSFDQLLSIYKMLIRTEWDLKRSSLNPQGLFDVLLYRLAALS